jgi:hypothetical protein
MVWGFYGIDMLALWSVDGKDLPCTSGFYTVLAHFRSETVAIVSRCGLHGVVAGFRPLFVIPRAMFIRGRRRSPHFPHFVLGSITELLAIINVALQLLLP